MITPDQIRAARALKGWSQGDLAARTGLAVPTIANIEISKQDPSAKTLQKIIDAFQVASIKFTPKGVEKDDTAITSIKGYYKYAQVLADALNTLAQGDEILFLGADARRSPQEVVDTHKEIEKKGIKIKYLCCEGNVYIEGLPVNCRWIPKKYFTFKDVITIYGNKVVTTIPMGGKKDDDIIMIIENEFIANNHKQIFEFFWDNSLPIKDGLQVRDFKNPMLDNYSENEMAKIAKEFLKNKKAGK